MSKGSVNEVMDFRYVTAFSIFDEGGVLALVML